MKTSASSILKSHKLRVTDFRKICISILQKAEGGISSSDIEKQIKDVDRTTLYRTLLSFEESGVIHHSVDANGQKKYALCESQCTEHVHHDNHLHFHCSSCGKTSCLNNEIPPKLKLPEGYLVKDVQFNLMGICADCNK